MSNDGVKTPEQLADEQRRDVMAYAYQGAGGKYYTVDADGNLIEAALGATLADGTKVQALTPEYQKIAETTAALMMNYRDMLALNDADRGILSKFFKGGKVATDGLSDAGKKFFDQAKNTIGTNIHVPGSDVVDAAGNIIDGAKAPFQLLGDILGGAKDVIQSWGGGTLNPDRALAVGIAYASAREVASTGRPLQPGIGDFFSGVFSKNFGSYLGAGFAWLLDTVTGFAEHLPGVGDWIKKQGWHKGESLAEHIEEHMRDADNERVEHEMSKFKKIGGIETDKLAVLTRGGTITTTDGTQTTINAANSDSNAPGTTNGAPTNLADAKKQQDAQHQNIMDRSAQALANHKFSNAVETIKNHPIAATIGGGGAILLTANTAGYAGGKVAHGFASSVVGEHGAKVESAEKLFEKSTKLGNKGLEARAGREGLFGSKNKIFGHKEANPEKAKELLDEANKVAEQAKKKLAEDAARKAANPKLATMAEEASEFPTLWSKIRHPIDYTLHKTGRVAGKVYEAGSSACSWIGEKASSAWSWCTGGSKAAAKTSEEVGVQLIAKETAEVGGKVALKTGLGLAGKALPIAGEVLMVGGDAVDGVKAAAKGDGKNVVRSTARIGCGGLLAVIGTAAGTGATAGLAGGPFAEISVPAGAIIGGILGVAGYYFGSKGGDAIVDKAFEKKEQKAAAAAAANKKPDAATQQDIDVLHQQAVDHTLRAQQLAAGHGKAFAASGVKTSVGALNTSGAPVNNNQAQTQTLARM